LIGRAIGDSLPYWRTVNGVVLAGGPPVARLWSEEKRATLEALEVAKEEGLSHLAGERERIMRMTKDEAIRELVAVHRIDSRMDQIREVADGGLLNVC
jgi:hypothetical protein